MLVDPNDQSQLFEQMLIVLSVMPQLKIFTTVAKYLYFGNIRGIALRPTKNGYGILIETAQGRSLPAYCNLVLYCLKGWLLLRVCVCVCVAVVLR